MNNSTDYSELTTRQDLFSSSASNAITTIFMIFSFGGFVNNLIVVVVSYKEEARRRPYSIILLNLFIGDMMFGLAIQPLIWIDPTKINHTGRMADFLCAISSGFAFFGICMTINTLSLSALTILRYFTIVRNYRGPFVTSNSAAKVYCIFTWIIGVIITTFSAMSLRHDQKNKICFRDWPKGINGSAFSVITTILLIVIPVSLMILCYTALVFRIWKQSRTTLLHNSVAGRAKKGVAVLIGLLILAFVICWSPLYGLWILGRTFNYFSNGIEGEYERQRWLRITMLFAMFNSILDPLIYAYSSSDYRKGLLNQLRSIQQRYFRSNRSNKVEAAPT